MELSLTYHEQSLRATHAAFVRGENAESWLKLLQTWNIPLHKLEVYPIPKSFEDRSPAGALVIFEESQQLPSDLVQPFGWVGSRLLLPTNAALFPALREEELREMLVWERQVFHPGIGLVGFSKKDQLNWAEILAPSSPVEENWGLAHPGLAPLPELERIEVAEVNPEEVLDSFFKEMEQKPIDELETESEEEEDWAESIKEGFFKGALSLSESLSKTLDEWLEDKEEEKEKGKAGQDKAEPGMLGRMSKWAKENLDDLKKKREQQLKKLMDLFEKNPEEALKYAMPLDSPYFHRGQAPPGSNLGEREVDFNLGGLGGGKSTDHWDIGNYYEKLRRKYGQTAQDALQKGDFRKAAFIYAHLLGDFNMAANVLKQGKFFREAAALYQDHLNNISAAASCLEEGELWEEAIPLYKVLKRPEKVGDLLVLTGQQEMARIWYRKSVAEMQEIENYLEASRILVNKLAERKEAEELLLKGWKEGQQKEALLNAYLDLRSENENFRLGSEFRNLLETETPPEWEKSLLDVLIKKRILVKDEETQEEMKDLAYELFSRRITRDGSVKDLEKLNQFVPKNKSLGKDIQRFKTRQRRENRRGQDLDVLSLKEGIAWEMLYNFDGIYVLVGRTGRELFLCLLTPKGERFEISLSKEVSEYTSMSLFFLGGKPRRLLFVSGSDLGMSEYTFEPGPAFGGAYTVRQADWFSAPIAGIRVFHGNVFLALELSGRLLIPNVYTFDGKLMHSPEYGLSLEGHPFVSQWFPAFPPLKSMEDDAPVYILKDKIFLIGEKGFEELYKADDDILLHALHQGPGLGRHAIFTSKGLQILVQEGDKLQETRRGIQSDLQPVALHFLPNGNLIVAAGRELLYFKMEKDFIKLAERKNVSGEILGLAGGPSANSVAVLTKNGQVLILDLEVNS